MPGEVKTADFEDGVKSVVDYGKSLVESGALAKVTLEEIVHGAGQPLSLIGTAFSTKDELTKLVATSFVDALRNSLFPQFREGDDAQTYLLTCAQKYLQGLLSQEGLEQYRTTSNVAMRQPEIANVFRVRIEEATRHFATVLEHDLKVTVPAGMEHLDASAQFFALCRGGLHHRMLFTDGVVVSPAEIETHAKKAVATFLRAFPLAA